MIKTSAAADIISITVPMTVPEMSTTITVAVALTITAVIYVTVPQTDPLSADTIKPIFKTVA